MGDESMLIGILFGSLLILTGLAGFITWTQIQKQKALQAETENLKKSTKRNEFKQLRDLEMARKIQSGLLVQNKIQYKNCQLSAICVPAEKIGGDFFIVNKQITHQIDRQTEPTKGLITIKSTKDEALNFAIGDVSGHGVASALVMILAKNTLEDLFAKKISPQKMMKMANQRLINYTEGSAINFVTAFSAVLDMTTFKLTFSKAGHTSPLLIRKTNEIIPLETEGVFLGMFENPDFEEKDITLQRGDKLFLYTDGLTEAKNKAGELFGTQRLTQVLKQNSWLSGENLFQKIMDDVKEYAHQEESSDDITMVLLELN